MSVLLISLRELAATCTIAVLLTALGCGRFSGPTTASSGTGPNVLFEETFERVEATQDNWSVVVPERPGAISLIADGAARLALPSRGEATLTHLIDVASVRGKRVRVTARVRTDSATADSYVAVSFGRSAADFQIRARTPPARSKWALANVVVDVDSDILRSELSLVLHGEGSAWFDDVKLESLGPIPPPSNVSLSQQQLESLKALTHAVALIRYRHPSDQAAEFDWDAFLPIAIERALQATDGETLLLALRELFSRIVPAVEFSRLPTYPYMDVPHRESDHRARWRRAGIGNHSSFPSWREGRDADEASVRLDVPVDLPRLSSCKQSQLRAAVRQLANSGEVRIYAEVEQGGADNRKRFDRRIASDDSVVSLSFEMPKDAYRVRLGLELLGSAAITLVALSLTCDSGDEAKVEIGQSRWEERGFTELYSHEANACGAAQCLTIARQPIDKDYVAARDILSVEISDHLWVHVPLAVWSDSTRTLPMTSAWPRLKEARSPTTDVSERIAILASAWGTLATFYPSFRDQHIDWLHELPSALISAAAARSTAETFIALSKLMARIRDAHAGAIHPGFPIDGILPLALRKFGDKLVVVGVFGDYAKLVPIGAEILAIDHVPVMQAYVELRERVSSSTSGWEHWAVPLRLTRGPVGMFSTVRIKTIDGEEHDCLMPHLSRDAYSSLVREPRPAFGASLAPGVHYVDLENMVEERWQSALGTMVQARALILDMRGYPSAAVLSMIGHFIDKGIRSPRWEIPVVGTSGYKTSYWMINPLKPRLKAKLVVLLDGRAASAAETFLQIVHDNHLATFVGETSAGTNGIPTTVALPGGFSMRFTAMRVPFPDGSALQGRGIVPDVVVHPTLEGTRAGRDEILEAGIDAARKLITN
jgi:hypothetical protein